MVKLLDNCDSERVIGLHAPIGLTTAAALLGARRFDNYIYLLIFYLT